jgi:hypothetical protein
VPGRADGTERKHDAAVLFRTVAVASTSPYVTCGDGRADFASSGPVVSGPYCF